jgi:predicted transcriptional regulator
MKIQEKNEAKLLRKEQGLSLTEIATRLNVAKSTVSLWVRDIELSQEQKNKLLEQNPIFNNQQKGAKKLKDEALIRRKKYQEWGREKARENNIMHAMGCMLYWGEGAKSNNKWALKISNSDCNLLRIFIRFLKICYGVKLEEIVIHIHCYTNNEEEIKGIKNFWLKNLNLPETCLRKTVINSVSKYSKRKRGNTLPYGTCHLAVNNVQIIQSVMGAIQEYGEFKNPDWV